MNHTRLSFLTSLVAALGLLTASSGCIQQSAKEALSRPSPTPSPSPSAATPESAHGPDDGHNHGPDDGHNHGAPANPEPPGPKVSDAPGKPVKTGAYVKSASGLQYQDEKVGTGAPVKSGQFVAVHYTGTLENGKKFDSSLDRGQPFTVPVGAGQVIKGWDEGLVGMKVGGKRKLIIPADLAYGAQSPSPDIPPNSTLLFDVEVVSISDTPPPPPGAGGM